MCLYLEVKADPAHSNATNHSSNFTTHAYSYGPAAAAAAAAAADQFGPLAGRTTPAPLDALAYSYDGDDGVGAQSGWIDVYKTETKKNRRVGPAAALSAAIGIFLIGPYSLLCGVFSADVGGKGSSGTASGIVDFCGYFGSIVFFLVKGQLPGSSYETIFLIVLLLAGSSLLCSFGFLMLDWKKAKEARRGGAAAEDGSMREALLLNARDPLNVN